MLSCRVDFQSCRLFEQLRIGQRFCRTFSSSIRVSVLPTRRVLCVQPRDCHQLTMSKKIVIKADLVGQKCKSEILAAVSKLEGIKSLDIDADKCTLTVVGTVDPVCVVLRLRKKCFAACIVSVEDDKPKKKEPCKEACEKLCKEKCDKITCSKDCKEKCEKECEKACEAWLGTGCCSCSRCKPGPAGFYYDHGGVPSCYPYRYGCPSSYPYYACYEERSPDGACAIQ